MHNKIITSENCVHLEWKWEGNGVGEGKRGKSEKGEGKGEQEKGRLGRDYHLQWRYDNLAAL